VVEQHREPIACNVVSCAGQENRAGFLSATNEPLEPLDRPDKLLQLASVVGHAFDRIAPVRDSFDIVVIPIFENL
jgi:hypothetical protein